MDQFSDTQHGQSGKLPAGKAVSGSLAGGDYHVVPMNFSHDWPRSLLDCVKSGVVKIPGKLRAQRPFFRFLRRACSDRRLLEQVARLRDAILLSAFKENRSSSGLVIGLTGTTGGEGSSLISVLLGLSLGECAYRKVALLDGQFNAPRFELLSQLLGLSQNSVSIQKGFAQLAGYYNQDHSNVYFLRNCSPEHGVGFFSDKRLGGFLEDLRTHFDLTLLDLPPVLKDTSSVFVLPHVDRLFLVAEAGKTRLDEVKRARAIVKEAGRELSGVILNKQAAPWWTRLFWRDFFF